MKYKPMPQAARILGFAILFIATGGAADAQVINDSGTNYTAPTDVLALDFGFDLDNSFGRLAIAAPGLGSIGGRVLVYDTTTGVRLLTLEPPAGMLRPENFGKKIAMEGTNIVVASYASDEIYLQSDLQVFVYDAVTGALKFELTPTNPLNDRAGYGQSIAIDNGIIAVGQPTYDQAEGCVYLFDAADGSQIDVIYGSDLSPSSEHLAFGDEIEMHNGLLAVSRGTLDVGFPDREQTIFIFDVATRAMLHEILPPMETLPTDGWGTDIAMNDDTLIVCAPGDDPYGTNTGSVFAYDLQTGEYRNRILAINPDSANPIRLTAEINDNGLVAVNTSNQLFGLAGSATVKLFESHTGIQVGSLEPSSGMRSASFGLAMTFLNNEIFVSDIATSVNTIDTVTHYQTGSTITMQPQSFVTDVAGFGQLMQVFATNATDYRWFKDGVEVNSGPLYGGATTSVLAINAGPETEGAYTCEVTSVSTSTVLSDPGYLVFQGASAPACVADLNGDEVLDFFDVSAFLQAFSVGCP